MATSSRGGAAGSGWVGSRRSEPPAAARTTEALCGPAEVLESGPALPPGGCEPPPHTNPGAVQQEVCVGARPHSHTDAKMLKLPACCQEAGQWAESWVAFLIQHPEAVKKSLWTTDGGAGGGPGQASVTPDSEMGGEAEPGRCGWSLRSVTLVRVLSIDNFNMGEGEEAPPPVDLPLPLAIDVHPGHLNDVADLGKQEKWAGLRPNDRK